MSALPLFYPIVNSLHWLERLLPLGAQLIQLRLKDCPADEVRLAVRAALAACRAHDAQLVVNDYWQEALDAGADFIHLGQQDLDNADLAEIHRRGLRLGISTHDYAELERALSLHPSYVALGPVYTTTSKLMPWAPQGLDRVREWKQRIGALPLVAIGGLTPERAPACLAAGADVLAVMSDFTRQADPAARIARWQRITRAHA